MLLQYIHKYSVIQLTCQGNVLFLQELDKIILLASHNYTVYMIITFKVYKAIYLTKLLEVQKCVA